VPLNRVVFIESLLLHLGPHGFGGVSGTIQPSANKLLILVRPTGLEPAKPRIYREKLEFASLIIKAFSSE
jgi:hypothetical protein